VPRQLRGFLLLPGSEIAAKIVPRSQFGATAFEVEYSPTDSVINVVARSESWQPEGGSEVQLGGVVLWASELIRLA
jgi:hypothetical protein